MKPAIPFLADTALATVDTLPPKLTSLSLPKTLYTAAGDAALWLSASASDEGSGILSLTLRFSSSFALDDGQPYLESVLILDHWNSGYAAALLDLDRATPAKSYAIEEAILEDRYGNTATYTQADLVSAGFPTGFAVAASGTNKPPTGQPTASLPPGQEDVAYTLKSSDLLKGFADPEGGALTLFNPSASHGQLAYNPAAKTWIFQPEAEYSGPVKVDYAVADDRGGVVSASRSFNLAAVNDPPAGTPSAKLPDGVQNKAYTLAKADLLQGIADSEGDSLNITQISANHGNVKSGSANTWIFSPEASYRGPVSLSYTVSDGHGGIATFQQAFTLAAADGSPITAGAPVLTGLSFPETVNLAKGDAGFAVTATGSDDGGAILSAIIHFGRAFVLDDGAPYLESLVILDTWADGSARADLKMDSATPDGAYAIADLTLEDQQGHVATYSASELAGLGFSTSFTVTHKAGSPPVNTVPGARSFYQGTTQAFSVKVADADSASLTVTLAATHGTLSLARTTGLSFVQGDGKDDAGLKFSGSLANLNAALDGLSFKPESGYVGSASLKITSSDGAQSDSDSVALTVRSLPPGPGVSIVPQQTPAITTENNALVTGKPGGAATFSVSLKTQPDSDVVLKFASNDTTEGTLANPTLTFTHSNWSTPQILTVRGVDDLDNDGDTAYTVSGQVVSEDINYIRGVVIANLTLTNQDDPEDAPMTGYGDQNAPNYRDPWTGGNGADTYYAGRDIDFVHGGLGNDKLYGQEDDDKLWGEGGGDTLWGGYGADQLDGAGGNDKLYGEQDDDVLNGGDGDDLLDGGQGADQMSGGKGADTYYVDDKGDQVDDQGTDGAIDTVLIPVFLSYTLGASIENGTLTGADNSNLTGNGLANALTGNSGNNVLDGGAGNDKLVGGAGNDTLKGGSGLDTADYSAATAGVTASLTTNKASGGGQGNDSFSAIENLLGGLGNDVLSGSTGSNSLVGGAGNDTLNGGAGNDSLRGGFGNDTLRGGDGSDLIAGGVGKDSLTGGAGADRFVYSDTSDTGLGSAARDVVADFSSAGGDKLDLNAWDAKPGLAGVQHWSFVASFSGVPGQVRFDAASHLVLFDHNGDKQADFQVELTGVSALSASDFVLA